MFDPGPIVGQWYEEINEGEQFKVLFINENNVKVEMLDGERRTFIESEWNDMALEEIDEPVEDEDDEDEDE